MDIRSFNCLHNLNNDLLIQIWVSDNLNRNLDFLHEKLFKAKFTFKYLLEIYTPNISYTLHFMNYFVRIIACPMYNVSSYEEKAFINKRNTEK